MAQAKLTPLMQQYMRIREQYPDTLLFFQVGDFYELFFDDARTAARYLAITLTKRGKCNGEDVPLCGVPRHAYRHYVTKLVKGGYRVAICDQLTEAKPGTVVERGVTQVITPATVTDPAMMDDKSASYLFSFARQEDSWGLVFGELLTAQLYATRLSVGNYRGLEAELARFSPDEIVIFEQDSKLFESYFTKMGYLVSPLKEDIVGQERSRAWVESQFSRNVQGHLKDNRSLEQSTFLFHDYIARSQQSALGQFRSMQFYQADNYLLLDRSTQRNLELVRNNYDASRASTLLSVLDRARTSMGSRTIKKWLTRPLLQTPAIVERQEVVQVIMQDVVLLQKLEKLLGSMSDIERIVGRIALGKAMFSDYLSLKHTLVLIPALKALLEPYRATSLIAKFLAKLADFTTITNLLEQSLNEESLNTLLIKPGFDLALDQMRDLYENGQQKMLTLEQDEIARSGINSLKIKYNKVTGYAIEVTKPNLAQVPEHYVRSQTLSNRERFVTPELVSLERDITRAQSQTGALEEQVFDRVKKHVYDELALLRSAANSLAYLDGLYSFARVAYDSGYTRPEFHDSFDLSIVEGRHPVIEQKLSSSFIPNDTTFTNEQSLWIITGPNMGGKSTYLRQVALISIMAQCGSFVPAKQARLPIVDRIFTRIGAADNLSEGKSTFFVEMEETASICRQATNKSLVILDEVGRGTSTYDGLAIAQSVIEYIQGTIGAKCLFATHYHELTDLAEKTTGIVNYHVLCEKKHNGIVFLHKLAAGISRQSFGLEVARLAHLPQAVVSRAEMLHGSFTQGYMPAVSTTHTTHTHQKEDDLSDKLVALEEKLQGHEAFAEQMRSLDFDELSPRQAYELLWKLKQDISK